MAATHDAAPPLLQTEPLRIDYHSRSGSVTAVQDLSIIVREGESVALVGESGSGKSTVARAMLGLLPPRIGADRSRPHSDRRPGRHGIHPAAMGTAARPSDGDGVPGPA